MTLKHKGKIPSVTLGLLGIIFHHSNIKFECALCLACHRTFTFLLLKNKGAPTHEHMADSTSSNVITINKIFCHVVPFCHLKHL